jgi:hypothetical protein
VPAPWAAVALLLAAACPAPHLRGAELKFDFSQGNEGELPAGFRAVLAGRGKPGDWRLVTDDVAPALPAFTPNAPVSYKRLVLGQVSRDPTDERFPLLVYDKDTFANFTFSARFKIVGGAIEQMAGLVFRYQNESNYYYLRASALGRTLRFYKVVNGERGQPVGEDIEITKDVWHELSVSCQATEIRCRLNGKDVLPAFADQSFTSGKIGFMTKSDSVAYFSDAHLTYTPRVPLAQTLVSDAIERYPRVLGLKIYGGPATNDFPRVLASTDAKEVGQPGGAVERDAIAKSAIYYGKEKGYVLVTMPLRDRNGDAVAAVKLKLKAFPGQTENTAVARATPIARDMEQRFRTRQELEE